MIGSQRQGHALPTIAPQEADHGAALWRACAPKTCCYLAVVFVTGRDVWDIASALDAPPASFLRLIASHQGEPAAIRLEPAGGMYRLALAKQRVRRATPAPCVFLQRLRGGQHRCAIADLRPAACQLHPAEVEQGVPVVRDGRGCTCREWRLADLDLAQVSRLAAARAAAVAEYAEVAAAWNDRVRRASAAFTLEDYGDYLMSTYSSMCTS